MNFIKLRFILPGFLCFFLPIMAGPQAAHALKFGFESYQFSFQLLRTAGYSSTGGADVAECLATAERIKDGDVESWYNEWNNKARLLEETASDFLMNGHRKSGRQAYFRASNYYRTAEFFLHQNPDDPRILSTWKKSRQTFQKAMALLDHPAEFVRIPYEDKSLPGYILRPDDSAKKRPLLIIHSGFDGTAEELYFEMGRSAVERGYSCLLIEGPGQGEMIRMHKIPFRHDWEAVITPAVDFSLGLPQTDPERIGLIGFSLGGYLAPRAVAFEPRIKSCVANPGIYDFYSEVLKRLPGGFEKKMADQHACEAFDKEIYKLYGTDVDTTWFFSHGMFTFRAKTPTDFIRKLKPYCLKNAAPRIKCRLLIADSEGDQPGQAIELFEKISAPGKYMLFTKEQDANAHCQMGAIMLSTERILNWLDDNL